MVKSNNSLYTRIYSLPGVHLSLGEKPQLLLGEAVFFIVLEAVAFIRNTSLESKRQTIL